ncbi:hypothetical protein GW17_00054789, partial [Ensete ventricosum]
MNMLPQTPPTLIWPRIREAERKGDGRFRDGRPAAYRREGGGDAKPDAYGGGAHDSASEIQILSTMNFDRDV